MPSHLRLQSDFEPISAATTRSYFVSSPPQKKQKMSLSQTYYVASSARSKLGREACKPDHDLRLLVGHANLLDSLMLELQEAEREQEAWFNNSVRRASQGEESRHIQWAEPIMEDDSEDSDDDAASDVSESDDEDFEEDFQMALPLRRIRSPPVTITTTEVDEDDFEDDEDDEEHALTRTPSNNQPPELVHDEESDDESPPTSPPQPLLEFEQIEAAEYYGTAKTLNRSEQNAFLQDGFFIPERSSAPLIATC